MNIDRNSFAEPVAVNAWSEGRNIFIELIGGQTISFPADRFIILAKATENQLKEVKIQLKGYALRWENLDEDLTVKGIISGHFQLPSPE